MKLFKKLILALSMLLLLGMITSCGGGAGGGPSSSGDGYKVVYNGSIIADDFDEEDIAMFTFYYNMQTPEDYSIDQSSKTITLTDDGMAKFYNAMASYTFVYEGNPILTAPGMMLSLMLSGYAAGTDYIRNDTTHTIEIINASLYYDLTTIEMVD
ncbi:MAG: hypothetical protein J6T20_07405 [Treponema sp.]|nr:hypothetical protein [Treponema sp.]